MTASNRAGKPHRKSHHDMRYVTNSYTVQGSTTQIVERGGREYLKFPIIPLKEMVLNYPEQDRKEYLSAGKIERSAPAWNGASLVASHPPERWDGQMSRQTARHPESWMGEKIGESYESEALNGGSKLRTNGLIDIERAESFGGISAKVVSALKNGEDVSVSAGYATMDDEKVPGTFEGTEYDVKQGDLVPDHIAIWPQGETGDRRRARCTLEDGCGAPKLNATDMIAPIPNGKQTLDPNALDDESAAGIGRWVLNSLRGMFPQSQSQSGAQAETPQTDCGGDCDCESCAEPPMRTNTEGEPEADADTTADTGTTDETETETDSDGEATATGNPESGTSSDESGNTSGGASGDESAETETQTEPQQQDTTMKNEDSDYTTDELAEQTPFDSDAIDGMDDEQRATLAASLETPETDSTESGGSDTTGKATETQTATTATTETPDEAADTITIQTDQWESMVQKVNSLAEREEERQSNQRDRQERIVVNAMDGVGEDDAKAMDDDTLEHFADKFAGQGGQSNPGTMGGEMRANYGAVPGAMDRTTQQPASTESAEDYDVAVSREQYADGE